MLPESEKTYNSVTSETTAEALTESGAAIQNTPEENLPAPTVRSMRRNVNHIFLWLLIYNGIMSVLVIVFAEIFRNADVYLGQLLAVVIGAALVYLCTFRKWPVKPFACTGKKMTGRDFATVFGAFCITQLLTLLITTITDAMGVEGTSLDMGTVTFCLFIYAAFAGPFVEELLYRGFSIGNGRILGKIPAIILAAFAFGLMHGNLSQFVIGMLGGLVLGYVFAEYSIWWSLLIHVINNVIGAVLMMVPESSAEVLGIVFYAIFGVFAVYSVIQMIMRRGEIKAWFADKDNRGTEGAVRSILTSPWFIVFTVLYAAIIILLMIFPDIMQMMTAG